MRRWTFREQTEAYLARVRAATPLAMHPNIEKRLTPPQNVTTGRNACIHQGEHVETRLCTGCTTSATPTPVYRCDLHGLCAIRPVRISDRVNRRDRRVSPCTVCADYVPKTSTPENGSQ